MAAAVAGPLLPQGLGANWASADPGDNWADHGPGGATAADPTSPADSPADRAAAEEQRLDRLRRLAQKGRRVEEPPKVRKGQVLARVGSDAIVESDLDVEGRRTKALNDIRAKTGGEVPADVREDVERQIKEALREPLKQRIETKLIYQNAAKNIPAASLAGMKKAIGKEFDKEQVPRLLKVFHVESRFELEAKLQEVNSSLEIQKSDFIEIVLAREWYHQQVKVDEDFVRDELLSYYRDHGPEFDRPGQVRWEQLSVCVAKYPSRDAARAVLAQMGNDVIRGVPFAEVAKARSDGPTAANGGAWPWTAQGSLVSQQIERAIFGLPVASLSRILEEQTEMHIVRVVERQEGTHIPFEEAQAQIRKKILKNREKEARDTFVNQIRKGIHVWTIYDNEAQAKRPPSSLPMR